MNICITNTQVFNPYLGGVESVSYSLAKEFVALGHQVIFLSQHSSLFNEEKEYDAVIEQLYFPDRENPMAQENIFYVQNLMRERYVDVVLNQAANIQDFSLLWSLISEETGVKVVSAVHFSPCYNIKAFSSNLFVKGKLGNNIKKWLTDVFLFIRFFLYNKRKMYRAESSLYRTIYEQSDAFVVLSPSYIEEFAKMIGDDSRLVAISNTIESCTLDVNQKKKNQILYLGRLEYGLKRLDRLIEIWKKLYHGYPDWELLIVGDGMRRKDFEDKVKAEKIERVSFLGFQAPEKYLRESKILCLVSTNEGFGMVLLEAMKYGCVPMAYDSFSALGDIIDHGTNGYRVPPFDEHKYIGFLRSLMNDEHLREEMAANAFEKVGKFDVRKVSKSWITLFESLLQRKRSEHVS